MSLMPEKSGRMRRYIASVLLSAGVLFSGLFSSDVTKAQTESSAQKNDVTQTDYPDYPGRQYSDFNVSTYTTVDQDSLQVPPDLMPLWQNMQLMKNSNTVIGPALARLSSEANIWFCYAEYYDDEWSAENYIKKLPSATARMIRDCLAALQKSDGSNDGTSNDNTRNPVGGWWEDSDGVAYMTKEDKHDADRELIVMAHELTHGIQNITGSSKYNLYWSSIRDFQACVLSYEAAASAYQYLIAWELAKDSVHMGPWRAAVLDDSIKCATIVKGYNDALTRRMPPMRSLERAGEKAFCHQLAQEWWLDAYNDQMLGNYIRFVLKDQLKPPVEDCHYNISTLQKTGYLSSEFNITADVDSLPSDLFGGYEEMRQAFDYADLDRYLRALGSNSELYQRKLAEAQKDNNPYLGVDMDLVYKTLEACDYNLMALSIMNYYADQLHPRAAPEYKNLAAPQR